MHDITLVTGSSGFLGGRLIEMLVERGEAVRALVRSTSDRSRLDDLGVDIAVGSLEDRSAVERAMHSVTRVFNCAGLSADWGRWADFHAANVVGVQNVLEAAHAGSVARVVHVSTTDVYGYPRAPCPESRGPRDVGLPYNRSKAEGDRLALEFGARTGLPVTVVRPATIFGPRSKDFVVEMAQLLLDGGLPTIDRGRSPAGLIYVDDLAEVMITLAGCEDAIGEAFNVRDPSEMTWRTYIDRLADGLPADRATMNLPGWLAMPAGGMLELLYWLVRSQKRPLLTRHIVNLMARSQAFPIDKLIATVGFRPTIGVERGIEQTLAWIHGPEGRAAIPR